MRIITCFITICCCLSFDAVSASHFDHIQSELSAKNWKKAHDYHSAEMGQSIVEWIPEGQTLENYREMVSFASYDQSKLSQRPKTVPEFLDFLKKITFDSYPGTPLKWNVIKKSTFDAMYEWQILKPFFDVEPQHAICRIIFDGQHLYQLLYVKKVVEIDPKTRNEWIQRLSEEH